MRADQESQATRPGKQKAGSSHSGRFLVRIPSELHEQLARAAERQDVSLNRYVTDALAMSVAPAAPDPLAPALKPDQDPPPESSSDAMPEPTEPLSPGVLRVALATNLVVVVLAGLVAVVLLVLALQRGI